MCEKAASRSGWEGSRETNLFTPEGKLSLLLVLFSSHLTKVSWSWGVWGSNVFLFFFFVFFFLNTSESNEDKWKSNWAFWLLHLIEIASVQVQQSDARCRQWHLRLHNILKVWNKFWLFLLMLTQSLAPQRPPFMMEHLYERFDLQFEGFLNWRQTTFCLNLSFWNKYCVVLKKKKWHHPCVDSSWPGFQYAILSAAGLRHAQRQSQSGLLI